MASAHSNKNEKTTEKLVAEIRSRLDWISVNFLDESKDKADNVAEGKVDIESVRLLDYACGTGMVSQVRISSHYTPILMLGDLY
jgi:hypothetical protein